MFILAERIIAISYNRSYIRWDEEKEKLMFEEGEDKILMVFQLQKKINKKISRMISSFVVYTYSFSFFVRVEIKKKRVIDRVNYILYNPYLEKY